MSRHLAAILALSILSTVPTFVSAPRYVRATVDQDGQLRILTGDGQAITIAKEDTQVGFEQIAISPDGASVGWVGLRGNCCTAYPIPMRLVILHGSERRTFAGNEWPVFRWVFTNGGSRVAFKQAPVHGSGDHYEWHDVASGRLIAAYQPRYGMHFQELPNQTRPRWARVLDAEP